MTILITKQGLADCSNATSVDRLLLMTNEGDRIYVAPTLDPTTSLVWFPLELEPTRAKPVDRLLTSCRATACGPLGVELLCKPSVGALLKLRVNHQRHADKPTTHDFSNALSIASLAVMTVHDLESLAVIP